MRISTYTKMENLIQKRNGYIGTSELLQEGFSNRQIAALTEERYLEKICHGYYWMSAAEIEKPKDFKCIEACLSNPRAVICMDSACYYQGMIKDEPDYLAVATERSDRSSMKVNFLIERHYFSDSNFWFGMQRRETQFGNYNIYDQERSICDMLRLRLDMDIDIEIDTVMKQMQRKKAQYERIKKYAELLNMKLQFKEGE